MPVPIREVLIHSDLDTFEGWKDRGYIVKKGKHAMFHLTDGNTKIPIFHITQIGPELDWELLPNDGPLDDGEPEI